MAFNKKKDDEQPGASAEAPDDDLASAFAAPPEDAAEPAAPEAAAPAPAPAADSTDALLSMFKETEQESNDRRVLVELAGDVELDDLVEDLRILAAALGRTQENDAA